MFTGNKCGDTLCREIEAERAATDAHLPFVRQIVACRRHIAENCVYISNLYENRKIFRSSKPNDGKAKAEQKEQIYHSQKMFNAITIRNIKTNL